MIMIVSESSLFEFVAEGEEMREVDVTNEEGVCMFQELGDGFVFAFVTEGAEVLLFLLFEDEHLVCKGACREHPVYEHQILTHIEIECICLHTTHPT